MGRQEPFLPILEDESPEGWDEVFGSHTFHEIQMYYPMRSIRDRDFKLIWNIAYQLPFPFASNLWASSAWQDAYKRGPDAEFGPRSEVEYINRPEFELFDVRVDPFEFNNRAADPEYSDVLQQYKVRLKEFQRRTSEPRNLKWTYQ